MILAPLSTADNLTKKQVAWYRKLSAEIYEKLSKDLHVNSVDEFLTCLSDKKRSSYILALRSTLDRHTIFHRRSVDERWTNNYNPYMLSAWQANMDIQFCLHPHAVGTYIASYMCKGNKHLTRTLAVLMKKLETDKVNMSLALRTIANSFVRLQELSAQEIVFLLLGLPFRFSSRSVLFVNTSTPEKRIVMLKTQKTVRQITRCIR